MHWFPYPYRLILWPLSLLYGALVRVRNLLYLKGILKSTAPSGVRIISVGNITTGGSGKTPVTIHLAERLKAMGIRVAVLSRGYRRTTRGTRVVSDGQRLLVGVYEAGDEPYLMARRLEGVPVVVSESRVKGAELIKERFHPQVILLDDGFQHLAIKRDLDVVLIDTRRLSENHWLLPSGPLREPLDSLHRADVILLKEDGPLPGFLASRVGNKPRWSFHYRALTLLDSTFNPVGTPELLRGRRVVAVCGVADPDSFFTTLEHCGAELVERIALADHHRYSEEDVEDLKKALEKTGAQWLVTTEKDGVKLAVCGSAESLPLRILTIDVTIEGEEQFTHRVVELAGIETQPSCDTI